MQEEAALHLWPPLLCSGQWTLMTTHQLRKTCVLFQETKVGKSKLMKAINQGTMISVKKKKNSLQVPFKQQTPRYAYNVISGINLYLPTTFQEYAIYYIKQGIYSFKLWIP